MASQMHLESELEIMAKHWLKRYFALETIKTKFAFEGHGKRYHIDLYGSRREGWKNSPHFFAVNCIPRMVRKVDFLNLDNILLMMLSAALKGLQDWSADYAMIFSSTGFTRYALKLAREKGFGAYLKLDSDFVELSRPMQLYYHLPAPNYSYA